jgi:hypothetical protein
MNSDQQNNGTPQIQGERNSINQRVSRLTYLGNSKKVLWSNRRRYRNI